ncbi:peptidylprolyl isomerase [Planktothrix sp. FACHB-1355]|uniref:peptidylprolyl isomerase n=1 Tax=Aerosakkonema funiforme FACHB-1375 TaxID=2949571 RepID=A0A926VGY7_9CYAN|nr:MULTISPECIES: peptidylprolyl isomerase [Oscillatoriales]MBD2183821.1 peptidylprolyl isomerase [Aerosakkonema funiforme FACHB-1375]MBD3558286.1 peptidylprolyl isomerase [Planktothrix sp. FACHB-1355]
MTELYRAGNRAIAAAEMLVLLNKYQLMPQFLRGLIVDRELAEIEVSEEESKAAIAQAQAQYQLSTPEALQAWLSAQGLSVEQFEEIVVRPLRVEKFKQATWGGKVESYFLTRKSFLDQVIYSLIRTKDLGLAQEIYFRIQEGEQSFAELAKQYSQGPEANTGGVLGPVPIRQPHPTIGQLLTVSQPGQLWPPRALAEWFVIIRLEKFIPAQLDEPMRRRLIDEMFETWLAEQVKQMGPLSLMEQTQESAAIT